MKKSALFFLLGTLLSLSGFCSEDIPAFFSCKKPEECLPSLFLSKKIWGRLNSNYQAGVTLWGMKPRFIFEKLNKEGEQRLERINGQLVPAIILPIISDPYELIIGFNHEIVHFLNSHQSLKYLSDDKKMDNCLSKYRLQLLKDEKIAFLEEINFWNQSPAWFKKHFENQVFESRLLGMKVSYKEFYKILFEKISLDSSFVEKRYIALGMYPTCANHYFHKKKPLK